MRDLHISIIAFYLLHVCAIHASANSDRNSAGNFVLKTAITDEIAKSYQENHYSDVQIGSKKILKEKLGEAFRQETLFVAALKNIPESEDEHGRYLAEKEIFNIRFGLLSELREKIIALVHLGLNPFTAISSSGGSLFHYIYDIDDNLTHYLLLKRKKPKSLKGCIIDICSSEAMIEHFYKAGLPFDLLDFFNHHGERDNGNVEKMLIDGGAKIDIRSAKGQTPLMVRLSFKAYGSQHYVIHALGAKYMTTEEDMRDVLILVNAGAERSPRCAFGNNLEPLTAAEYIRKEFVTEQGVETFASVADYMDSFGLTLCERIIRSIILNARNKKDPEALELIELFKSVCINEAEGEQKSMPVVAQEYPEENARQNILNLLKNNQELFDACLDELMPERAIVASDHMG